MAIEVDPGALPEGVAGSSVQDEPSVPPPGATAFASPVVRFFVSVFLSLYGDWLTTVALVVLLFELTGSPAGPAAYLLARVAPRLVGPWIGGTLADRVAPQRILVVAFMTQAVFTASLIASHQAHALWALYLAVAAAQFVGAVARPSQGALLPTLVSAGRLRQANALYGTFFSTSIFVGPAVGAALLLRTGPDLLFAIDAMTFVLAAIFAATIPFTRTKLSADEIPLPSGSTVSTLSVVIRDPVIRLSAAVNFTMGLTITVTQALLVVAAHERFGNDAAVGVLYASVGIGGTVGGLFALRWQPPQSRLHLIMYVAAIGQILALALFAATPQRYTGLLLLALNSVASAALDVWSITEVQRRAPAGYMGRFNAIPWAAQYAGMLIGAFWALGTANLVHWDVAIEVASLGMTLLIAAVAVIPGADSVVYAGEA